MIYGNEIAYFIIYSAKPQVDSFILNSFDLHECPIIMEIFILHIIFFLATIRKWPEVPFCQTFWFSWLKLVIIKVSTLVNQALVKHNPPYSCPYFFFHLIIRWMIWYWHCLIFDAFFWSYSLCAFMWKHFFYFISCMRKVWWTVFACLDVWFVPLGATIMRGNMNIFFQLWEEINPKKVLWKDKKRSGLFAMYDKT